MAIDLDLTLRVLTNFEEADGLSIPLPDDPEERTSLCRLVLQLRDAGMVKAIIQFADNECFDIIPIMLTLKGENFLADLRKPKILDALKRAVKTAAVITFAEIVEYVATNLAHLR